MPVPRKLKIATLSLLLGFLTLVPAAGQEPPSLVLLFTNDIHSAVLPHRVSGENGIVETRGGIAKIATMIKAERELSGDKVLAVDAGDMVAGSLFQVLFQSEAAELRLMHLAGIDVATLGNHEFDYGPAALARALTTAKVRGAAVPIVFSNAVFDSKDDRDNLLEAVFEDYPVREYLVLERGGFKIGLFGLMGKLAADDAVASAPVKYSDAIRKAREVAEKLRNQEKVDIIIALSHSGVSSDPGNSEDEKLAAKVPDIDVIVSGHPHRVIPRPIVVGSTIIVGVGERGEELGYLKLRRGADGRFLGVSHELRPVSSEIPDDPAAAAEIANFQTLVDSQMESLSGINPEVVVAETDFAVLDQRIPGLDSGWEIGLGDLVADSFRHAVRTAESGRSNVPALVIHSWGLIRDGLHPGPITGNDVFSVLSLGYGPDEKPGYPLLSVWLYGREIRRLFEVETTVAPGNEDAHLQISGALVRFNSRRVPFDRVTRVEIEDAAGKLQPLDPDRLYRIVADLYMVKMIGYVSKASYGILKLEPKDAEGKPRTDYESLIVDGDPGQPGIQEIKEWIALASYLRSFADSDGDGVPEIPSSYASSAGRLVDEPSWNPGKLLGRAHGPTYFVLGLIVFIPLLLWFIIRKILRRIARRINKAAPQA